MVSEKPLSEHMSINVSDKNTPLLDFFFYLENTKTAYTQSLVWLILKIDQMYNGLLLMHRSMLANIWTMSVCKEWGEVRSPTYYLSFWS